MIASFLRPSAAVLAAGISLWCLPLAGAGAFDFTTTYTFTPATDGNVPYPSLVEGADGKLYGTNSSGGKNDHGTAFAFNPNGNGFTVLTAFPDTSGGSTPQGGLVQARDGNFYGTTNKGGANGYGILYRITPGSPITYLGSFNNADPGGDPVGTLIEGIDGSLYGTAEYGGLNNYGTVYRAVESTGVITAFAEITGGFAGTYPRSDLIQANDDNFYGTTFSGGATSNGAFFQVTPAGIYTVLYSFSGDQDGGGPLRGVVQGRDGYFYGVTTTGGAYSSGTIYRIGISGTTATLTVLYSFNPALGDGSSPDGTLLQATDGNFYGTTAFGGTGEAGTVYRVTSTGGFATLYDFANGADSGYPVGGLTEASDGKLYGTTAGNNGSSGTIFKINLGLPKPAPVAYYALTTAASAGTTVYIKGSYLVGTTAVLFTGAANTTVAATSFTVLSKTIIGALVPTGAVTGPITVTTAGGNSTSALPLTITNTATPTPTPTPTPVPTPSVTIISNDPVATRTGDTGSFKIVRSGDRSQDLTIPFKQKGTAVRGTDYNLVVDGQTLAPVTKSVTLPAGSKKLRIKVEPVPSSVPGPDTTVTLKLKAGSNYGVDAPKKATVEIAGNTGGS